MNFGTTNQSLPRVRTKNDLSSQPQSSVSKKEQYYVRRTKGNKVVQTIPFVKASRDDDARSCPHAEVYASGLHPNSPRILE